jgi:hypothetical protein
MKQRAKFEPEPIVFEVMGILSIVLSIGSALFGYFKVQHPSGHELSAAIIFAIYFILAGAGLIFQRRIAAVMFSAPLSAVAVCTVAISLRSVSFSWLLFDLGFAVVMLLPSWLTWRGWSSLR